MIQYPFQFVPRRVGGAADATILQHKHTVRGSSFLPFSAPHTQRRNCTFMFAEGDGKMFTCESVNCTQKTPPHPNEALTTLTCSMGRAKKSNVPAVYGHERMHGREEGNETTNAQLENEGTLRWKNRLRMTNI